MELFGKKDVCFEQCGSIACSTHTDLVDQVKDININDFTFVYDEVIHANSDIDMVELFSQTSYGYKIGGMIDMEITQLFTDIKCNKKLMANMSTEIIYLLNLSTCSIKKLFKYLYMLYICKYLGANGGTRCKNIEDYKYTSIIDINMDMLIDSINDELRTSEVVDAYIGFTKDILIKKYYQYLIDKLDHLEGIILVDSYEHVDIWMNELFTVIKNIIQYNLWFIIELNNFYTSDCKSPVFYINDRMISFYYGEIKLNYISWQLNYITPDAKVSRVQNMLEDSMLHYYENIKDIVLSQTSKEVVLVDV